MSLDFYIEGGATNSTGSGIFVRKDGQTIEISREEWDAKHPGEEPIIAPHDEDDREFNANITHNLAQMADEAGLYKYLWRPEENGITHAHQLIPILEEGLKCLEEDRARLETFNPENGWGDYDGLVRFVASVLRACRANPSGTVTASR